MKYLVITGVSSGIGEGCTAHFIKQGYHVFGSVRNEADAHASKLKYGQSFTPLIFDVRDIPAISAAAKQVQSLIGNQNLTGLINNAGIAVSGPIQFIDPKEVQDQFDINVIGVINVTRGFLSLLGGRLDNQWPPGRVIHMGSVAGTFTMPMQIPYAASKHAIEAITDGMRREFDPYGIKVVTLRPGPVQSAIWAKEKNKDPNFNGTIYEKLWNHKEAIIDDRIRSAMSVDIISRTVEKALTAKSPKLFYIVSKNMFRYHFLRLLPRKWVDRMIRKQMRTLMEDK